jgi:hypothetical protein
MVWKEVHAERGGRMHWFGRVLLVVLVAASFMPLWPMWEELETHGGPFMGETMNVWVRGVGTGVALLMLIGVAVRAAASVTGERERQTFDALLTSPLESGAILYGKWLGNVLSMRWVWAWLAAIWLLGVLTGGLSPLAVPFLVAAWFCFAAFVAALGLWYSTVCPNSLRATLWTLFTLVVVWGSHWLVWMCCVPMMIGMRVSGGSELDKVLPRVFEFQAFALTPPATLGFLAFRIKDFENLYHPYDHTNWGMEFLACSLLGMAGWAVAAAVLWSATLERFNQLPGRLPRRERASAGPSSPLAPASGERGRG